MKTVYTNSVEKSGSTNKSFGYIPVPGNSEQLQTMKSLTRFSIEKLKNIS